MAHWKHCEFKDIKSEGLTHSFDAPSRNAIRAALAARRPLLVRGEPGVGKTQLAYAAAVALERPIVTSVITSRTEAQDLLFRFDAVARLGQAQVLACPGASAAGGLELLEEQRFVQPGPLWWVFDWAGANRQWRRSAVKGARPEWTGFADREKPRSEAARAGQSRSPATSDASDKKFGSAAVPAQAIDNADTQDKRPDGVVLLIDEIDKADTDVPNALLECLGQGWFSVPYFDEPVRADSKGEAPLIVITTNEEKELPAAFVRRCLVLGLDLPTDEKLAEFLVGRGRAHFDGMASEAVLGEAARQLVEERRQTDRDAPFRPGQAEYLDIVRAVVELAGPAGKDDKAQLAELAKVASYCLKKAASSI